MGFIGLFLYLLFCLLVPVQVIAWKDSSQNEATYCVRCKTTPSLYPQFQLNITTQPQWMEWLILCDNCIYRGLKPVEKREGGGAHNWGTIADAVA